MDNNLLEGHPSAGSIPATANDGKGANLDAINAAQTRNRYPTPGAFPDTLPPDKKESAQPSSGLYAAGVPGTHRAFIEANQYESAQPNQKLVIDGENTIFRGNTIKNMGLEVTLEARRTSIDNNLFEADSLLAQVDKNNERLESVLANIRIAYEERWKSLSDASYRANEELLASFEKSAREKPPDREKMRTLLQKVIDATPKQPS